MLRELISTAWYHAARCMCVLFTIVCFGFKAYGRENIPKKGAFLLLSNHQSFLDPIFCAGMLPIKIGYLARDTLFTNWFFGGLIRSVNAIPVKRGAGDVGAMKKVIARLNEGMPMCLFPEGTRSGDGRIARIKPGVALLGRRAGAVVVPMVIEGAFEAWPKGQKLFTAGRGVVSYYGKPIPAETIRRMGDERFAEYLTEVMREMQNRTRVKLGKEPFDYSGEAVEAGAVLEEAI